MIYMKKCKTNNKAVVQSCGFILAMNTGQRIRFRFGIQSAISGRLCVIISAFLLVRLLFGKLNSQIVSVISWKNRRGKIIRTLTGNQGQAKPAGTVDISSEFKHFKFCPFQTFKFNLNLNYNFHDQSQRRSLKSSRKHHFYMNWRLCLFSTEKPR